jgi:hypothetical protein
MNALKPTGGQVWVAQGTYLPLHKAADTTVIGQPITNRYKSFVLVKDVQVYGGFQGLATDTSLDQRNWHLYESILSGDIGIVGDSTDNSYHVVISAGDVGNACLDGFIITNGNAGGGINIYNVTVNGYLINRSEGGGIYIHSSSLVLTNIIISGNRASESYSYGGGIFNHNSSLTLTNATITKNMTGYAGGGISNHNSSSTLINVTISENIGNTGGGIFNHSSSSLLDSVIISGNIGNGYGSRGGGIFNGWSSLILTNVIIRENKANVGGGIHDWSSLILTNVIISGNLANAGGGVYNDNSSPNLTNVTISGNRANKGGGIFNSSSFSQLNNTLIWENNTGVYDDTNSVSIYTHCLLQEENLLGNGNLDGTISYPSMFIAPINASAAPTILGDYHLNLLSPAINVGDNTKNTQNIDLDGNSRINCIIDLGAYEYQGKFIIKKPIQIHNRNICYGDSTELIFDLIGNAPWEIIYNQDNGQTYDTIHNILSTPYRMKIYAEDTSLYNIVYIKDSAYCEIEANDSLYVYITPTPTFANLFTSDTLCHNTKIKAINFTGFFTDYEWEIINNHIDSLPRGIQTNNYNNGYTLVNNTSNPITTHLRFTPYYRADSTECIGLADSFSITVLPEVILQTVLENDTLCSEKKTKAITFSGATHYQWTNNGASMIGIPTGTQNGHFGSYLVENKTTNQQQANIRVTPQYKLGNKICLGETDNFEIVVHPQTQIQSITRNKSIFCEEEQLEIQVNATGGNLNYQWYQNNNLLAGATTKNYIVPIVSREDKGTYYVEVSGICGTEKSKSIVIEVSSDKMLVEKWDDVILVDNSNYEYTGYQWYKDDKIISGATNQFYQELGGLNGCYSVELTLANGQKERSCERCVEKATKGFQVFPNPVKQGQKLQVVFYPKNKQTSGQIQVELYTMDGKKLWVKNIQQSLFELETNGLASGIYVIKALTEEKKIYHKSIAIIE